jgi:DEAD/DEAH box helicase domain-containing protein
MEPVPLALSREWQRLPARELRIYLGGDPDDWEPLAWSLRHDLVRFAESGVAVSLIIPRETLNALQDSQREELAILAGFTGARVFEISAPAVVGSLPLCLELGTEGQAIRWAASDPIALAPAPDWGSGNRDASFVWTRAAAVTPIPANARELDLAALRPSSPDLVEIRISDQLDGSSVRFGERAWALVLEQVPTLGQWIKDGQRLETVRYTDRYLRSPLTLHLLGSLLRALAEFPGGIGIGTEVTVQTARLERLSPLEPQAANHDWRDAEDRRFVAGHLLEPSSAMLSWVDENEARRLPHARELELRWEDGRCARLRFDQGVGFWRIIGGRSAYPFGADAVRQLEAFKDLRLRIAAMSREHPTLWYAAISTAASAT